MKIRKKYDYDDRNTAAETFNSRDGKTKYAIMVDGSHRRLSPVRPWRGKSERRQVLKDRRDRSGNGGTP